MLVSGLVFGYLHGITHPYDTAAIAPAIAAVIAISARELWRARQFASSRATLALMLVWPIEALAVSSTGALARTSTVS